MDGVLRRIRTLNGCFLTARLFTRIGRRPAHTRGTLKQGIGRSRGDGAFDADRLVEEVDKRGAMAVFHLRRNRSVPREHDREMYQVGNFFTRIREFRAISTRHDKTDVGHAAAVHLVA